MRDGMGFSSLTWFKSSRSSGNGACVTCARVPGEWFKSSRSSGNGECVTCARLPGDGMAVKDSKDPASPVLLFGAAAWHTFTQRVKRGEL
jgi:hypothetical protein